MSDKIIHLEVFDWDSIPRKKIGDGYVFLSDIKQIYIMDRFNYATIVTQSGGANCATNISKEKAIEILGLKEHKIEKF